MAAKSVTATWLGDDDPLQQVITEGGVRFIKGEATEVPGDLKFNGVPWAQKIRRNPMFSVEDEPEDGDADEKAELKARLKAAGEEVKGNPSLETLRARVDALG